MKSFLLVNLVFAFLVLVSAQVNVFTPLDFESESEFPQDSEAASTFSQKSQYFPHSNLDEPSLLSQSELPQDSTETKSFPRSNDDETSSFIESERPYDSLETRSVFNSNAKESCLFSESEQPFDSLEIQNFPDQTSQFSESGFSKELNFPGQSFEAPGPSPVETPAPSPAPSKNTCKHKCFKKCNKIQFPILRRLCHYVCQRKCLLSYSVQIYNCTARCAESMPAIFKSDKKKADGYVNYCYTKCIKKF